MKDISATEVIVSLFLACSWCFFGPLNIYLLNLHSFSTPYSHLLLLTLLLAIIILTLLLVAIALLPAKIYPKLSCLLFALAFLFWLQGNILVWDRGIWSEIFVSVSNNIFLIILDLLIYLGVIWFILAKSAFWYPMLKPLSIAFILVQLTSFILFSSAKQDYSFQKYTVQQEQKYNFSPRKNIIVMVLDAFQTDIFYEIILRDKGYQEMLDGFTYYRNTVGGQRFTYTAIPLILTGQYYDNSCPVQTFLKKAYTTSSLLQNLKKADFQVEVYTYAPYSVYYSKKLVDNIQPKQAIFNDENLATLKFVFSALAFRHSPCFLKYFLWQPSAKGRIVATANSLYDLEFSKNLQKDIRIQAGKNCFKFYHLKGIHIPLIMNENLQWEIMEENRRNTIRQGQGVLKLVKIFLTTLKKQKIYDNSLIFILGDHGKHYGSDIGVNQKLLGTQPQKNRYLSALVHSAALPLLLIKPFATSGPLKISDKPATLADIPKTATAILQIPNQLPGKNILQLQENEQRIRRFLWAADMANGGFGSSYFPELEEFLIEGFSWSPHSWKKTYYFYYKNGKKYNPPANYRYATPITFGKNGNYHDFKGVGWSYDAETFTLTDGKYAVLKLYVAPTNSDLLLQGNILGTYLHGGRISHQTVHLYAQGKKVTTWKIGVVTKQIKAIIPNSLLTKSKGLEIEFKLPDARSPRDFGIDDPRLRGIGFTDITIYQLDQQNH